MQRRLIFSVSTLCLCMGCWQEVHYNPPKTPVADVVRRVSDSSPEPNHDNLEHPIPEGDSDTVDFTADSKVQAAPPSATAAELFGASGPSDIEFNAPDQSNEPVADTSEAVPMVHESTVPKIASTADVSLFPDEAPPTDDEATQMRPSRTAFAVWRMASRWSYAAAIYAKGQPEHRYRDALEQARYAAELMEAELPEFPTAKPDELEPAVIRYLLEPQHFGLTPEIAPEYQALAELAIKTHLLLLVYTPKSSQLEPLITAVQSAAEQSGLPADLWQGLVHQITDRAPYSDVKRDVLSFHVAVGEYLSDSD